jgi:hypothetical protein
LGGIITQADGEVPKMTRTPLKGEARWKDIEDLINRWAKRDKIGALELEESIKDVRENLTDKEHGVLENDAMAGGRIGIMLHPTLEQYIKAFYPDFLETKDDLHEFMRRFPKFKVRKQI